MNDFKELSELQPSPRPTPTWALWLMAAVVVVGSSVLVWSESADRPLAGTQLTQARAYPSAARAAGLPAAPSSSPQAR